MAGARDAVAVDVASASERRSRSERESGWRATQFLQRDECDEDLGREMSMFFAEAVAAHVAAERDA